MRFVLIAATLMFCAAGVQAKIYKWTDSQGRVHYASQPPADAQPSEVRISPTSPATGQEGEPDESNDAEAERTAAEPDEPSADSLSREEALRHNCELARQNLNVLEDPSIRRFREDGQEEAIYYTDEQRQARIEQAQAMIERFCLEDDQD